MLRPNKSVFILAFQSDAWKKKRNVFKMKVADKICRSDYEEKFIDCGLK